MRSEDRYDSLIQWYWGLAEKQFGKTADVDWRLVKAQVQIESDFNPYAKNPRTGALGLLQIMAKTDLELDNRRNADNPEECIKEGISYLWRMWSIFKKEGGVERWRFALASYNAGAGHIIKAQALADTRGLDPSRWANIARVLPEITGAGNAAETTAYVAKIMRSYETV